MTCASASLAVDVLGANGFDTIAQEWEALLGHSYDNRIFLTPTWHRLWREHFRPVETYLLTARGESSILLGILPLQIRFMEGERVLSLTGDPEVTDYMDAIVDRERAAETLSCLWTRAFEDLDFDRVEIRHVPSSSPLIPALHETARGFAFSVEDDEVSPVALLCGTWDGYLTMLSKKQRHEIRRKLRRVQEGAEWSWRTATTVDELDRDLPVFFRLHEASAGEKQRFMTEDMRRFFYVLASAFLEQGSLRLSVLRRDRVDIAASFAFLYRDRYLLYNSGYDPTHASISPGIAAVALAMQDAIAEKAVAFDFLSGDEPYKYQFGATNTYTCKVQVRAADPGS